jgi:cobalamin biosynthesis Mg chelatase CobN
MALVCPKCLESIDDPDAVRCPQCGSPISEGKDRKAKHADEDPDTGSHGLHRRHRHAHSFDDVAEVAAEAGVAASAASTASETAVIHTAAAATATAPAGTTTATATATETPGERGLPGIPAGARIRLAPGAKARRSMRIGGGASGPLIVVWLLVGLVMIGLIVAMIYLSSSSSGNNSGLRAAPVLATAALLVPLA